MYSETSILVLTARIGFGNISSSLEIDEANKIGTSGRMITYFHKLANLDNIYATVNKIDMNSAEFNAHLLQMKIDAVKAVLTDILDKNRLYQSNKDYSGTITSRPELFDDPIGYAIAISAIEQMVSTSRIGIEERNANLKYDKLKIELEGARDREGNVVAVGIGSKYQKAIKDAAKIIFPNPITIEPIKFW